jgi:hypothetical protein
MAVSGLQQSGDVGSQINQLIATLGSTNTSDGRTDQLKALNAALAAWTPPSSSLALAPTGATGETVPRQGGVAGQSQSIAAATGTLYLSAIYLPINTVVNNFNILIGSTASSGVTHNWMLLATAARVPVAVSADNTTTDLTASTVATYAVANVAAGAATSYVVPASGMYYLGFMMAVATTAPTMAGYTGVAATVNNLVPKTSGTSNTGATTPPSSFTAALTAITGTASTFYGYTT